MAFPFTHYEDFEAGTKGAFDSEVDTDNRLDFPHQRHLGDMMPWRGAYCCRVNLGKSNADAYLQEDVSWVSGTARWFRFKFFIGQDVQFGNDLDRVTLLQFYSSTATKEARLLLARLEPIGLAIVTEVEGESWNNNNAHFRPPVGEWFTIEVEKKVSSSSGFIGAVLPGVCRISSREAAEGTITKWR